MDDTISRQAVIDRINKQREHLNPSEDSRDLIGDSAYKTCIEFIKRLPSAQKTGEWIEIDMDEYKAKCSSCGIWSPIMGNYCPNCGSRNRGEEDTILYFALCLDEDKKCPKECFRRQLNEDLKKNPQPRVSWMHFEGTAECMKGEEDG